MMLLGILISQYLYNCIQFDINNPPTEYVDAVYRIILQLQYNSNKKEE